MDLFKKFGTDKELERDGVWVAFEEDSPTQFLIARAGGANKRYHEVLNNLLKPYHFKIQKNMMESHEYEKITKQVFLQCCIKDWKGVSLPGSKEEIPFSVESASKLFDEIPELYAYLRAYSDEFANYRQIYIESQGN